MQFCIVFVGGKHCKVYQSYKFQKEKLFKHLNFMQLVLSQDSIGYIHAVFWTKNNSCKMMGNDDMAGHIRLFIVTIQCDWSRGLAIAYEACIWLDN